MATPKRRTWIVLLLVLLAGAAAAWYAHKRGWLSPIYARMPGGGAKSKTAGSGNGAMDGMNMPGMDKEGMAGMEPDGPAGLPGHAALMIPGAVRQRIGVMVGTVKKGPLRMSVQTVGIIQPDETKIARVHLRTEGWVEQLSVNFTGQIVRKGDPLLTIYSQEFLTTQQEYLTARRMERGEGGRADGQSLAELARRRLELLDVPRQALEALEQSGVPQEHVMLRSPITGTVLEKNVREKEYVTPQKELYVIADLSTVWVQAKVYEYELPHVELGQPAAVTIPALSKGKLAGKVVFIQPTVEEGTRTTDVRIELPNEDGLLKPGMFAHVTIAHQMGDGLLVPSSAIIRTGEKDIAYRVASPGTFMPVEVKIDDVKFGDRFHVLEGLEAGDKVVTSANFLIDSESRLREGAGGMAGMAGMGGMDMGDMEGMDHSKMKETDRQKKSGVDHSKMKETDRQKKSGMDHSKMKH